MRKAALEVGINGQIDGLAQRGEMLADIVERNAIVGLSDRPRKARAGGGNCLEAHVLQRPRAADIPGVGQHEAASLVHLAECCSLVFSCCGHDLSLACVWLRNDICAPRATLEHDPEKWKPVFR